MPQQKRQNVGSHRQSSALHKNKFSNRLRSLINSYHRRATKMAETGGHFRSYICECCLYGSRWKTAGWRARRCAARAVTGAVQ